VIVGKGVRASLNGLLRTMVSRDVRWRLTERVLLAQQAWGGGGAPCPPYWVVCKLLTAGGQLSIRGDVCQILGDWGGERKEVFGRWWAV
jgi:hypothetical protein